MKNYYHILGIHESASADEIKKAYRKLAFQYHPDTNTDAMVAEKIREINEAKHVLLNDVSKSRYDILLEDEHKSNGFFTRRTNGKPKSQPAAASKDDAKKRTKRVVISVAGSAALILIFLLIINIEPKVTKYFSKSMASAAPVATPDNVVQNENTVIPSANTAPINSEKDTNTGSAYGALQAEVKQLSTSTSSEVNDKPLSSSSSPTGAEAIASIASINAPPAKAAAPKKMNTVASSTPLLNTQKATTTHQEGAKSVVKEKQLSEQDMLTIVSNIKIANARVNKTTKCVKLMKATASNVSNAFDLAALLRSNGFTISGREEVNTSYNGVAIDVTDDCIKVLIGTM